MGNCENDTLKITGADAVTMKNLPMNLCGMLTGQHIYLSVKDVSSVQLTIALGTIGTQNWKILFSAFDSSQTDYLAPRGCLQYHRNDVGVFKSFNSNGYSPELLNDHMYSICIGQSDPYCDVALVANLFDLAGSAGMCWQGGVQDFIAFGWNVQCGTSFGVNGVLQWNYSMPYVIFFMSDSDNSGMNFGFEISYVLLPC